MRTRPAGFCWRGLLGVALATSMFGIALAAKMPDVRNTKHNLSVSGPGTVKATSETQICVFCHTPHAAEAVPGSPLWNRNLSGATYSPYTSSSIEASAAELAASPGGSSKLCLSCHDGTLAISSVNVLSGQSPASIDLTGAGAGGTMPGGAGTSTGFTRNLGVNLTNDHPISFTYDSTLAANDGELRVPDGTTVGTRQAGVSPKPLLPLENGQVQCTSCHDPHIRETDAAKGNAKFLRLNRLQVSAPGGGSFNATADIVCLACHDKAGQTWAGSVHANPLVADENYTDAAADLREFPRGTKVWQAACLNCHDTHTVQGSRRLLREGTEDAGIPKTGAGGKSAVEETCYQCHTVSTESVVTPTTTVPNIKSDFLLSRRMPIKSADQPAGAEVHDIGTDNPDVPTQRGKDFIESRVLLGYGDLNKRHAECTDCHNPHRVIKNRVFYGNANIPDAAGTHSHGAGHTNIASGVLRGTWGVEPVYGSAVFGTLPLGYTVKKGDSGTNVDTSAGAGYVTREYQVCLKCHSDYAYGSTPPSLGHPGGTPSGTNGLIQYTNQAMEFHSPDSHKGQASTTDSGAGTNYRTNNHRSWHPVMNNTGRTTAVRNASASNWLAPWNGSVDIGNQTMYCSDCHGSSTAAATTTPSGGEDGNPWGPHGSTNNFILKGAWDGNTGGAGTDATGLCFKCHSYALYATRGGGSSGFGGPKDANLHSFHADKIGKMRCSWCHTAVPHGWKNKAFLVNLNDVGPEVGLAAGTQVRNNTTAAYNRQPYYLNALLKVRTFATSGNWNDTNCGSAGAPGNGQSGRSWMRDSNENCANPP